MRCSLCLPLSPSRQRTLAEGQTKTASKASSERVGGLWNRMAHPKVPEGKEREEERERNEQVCIGSCI